MPNIKTDVDSVPFLRDAIHINLDRKWTYIKSQWLEQLLQSKQSLLFSILYLNGRRIKSFESVVLEYIYKMQVAEIDRNPEYNHHYLVVLEEAQNAFGTYSLNSDDSLELFTLFTQSRSDGFIRYLVLGQRLNDISCKVVERLRVFCGLTLGENSLRKLKSMIPDPATKARIQQLPKRHWIYLDGKTNSEIEIPIYKKEGRVSYLKPPMPQPTKPKKKVWLLSLLLQLWKNPMLSNQVSKPSQPQNNDDCEEDSEESELDEYMTNSGSVMFPTDDPNEI